MKEKLRPIHYPDAGKADLIQFALENNIGALEFNVFKYLLRWRKKNGLEDLYKGKEYLDRLIKDEEENGRIN